MSKPTITPFIPTSYPQNLATSTALTAQKEPNVPQKSPTLPSASMLMPGAAAKQENLRKKLGMNTVNEKLSAGNIATPPLLSGSEFPVDTVVGPGGHTYGEEFKLFSHVLRPGMYPSQAAAAA